MSDIVCRQNTYLLYLKVICDYTDLFSKIDPVRILQIGPQSPDETDPKVRLVSDVPQVRQPVHDHAHLGGVHDQVVQFHDPLQGAEEVLVYQAAEHGLLVVGLLAQPGLHQVFDGGVFVAVKNRIIQNG